MAAIHWNPSGDASLYGDNATIDDMSAMDALMVEYIESLGHDVTICCRTDSDAQERYCDDMEAEKLNQLFNDAWDYACSHYEPQS